MTSKRGEPPTRRRGRDAFRFIVPLSDDAPLDEFDDDAPDDDEEWGESSPLWIDDVRLVEAVQGAACAMRDERRGFGLEELERHEGCSNRLLGL